MRQKIVKIENEKTNCYILTARICKVPKCRVFVLTILWPAFVIKLEELKQHSTYWSKFQKNRAARTCLRLNILLALEQLITCSGAYEMYQFVHSYSPPINIKTNDL